MKRDNLTIALTPNLLERLQAAGLVLGAGNVAVWLTEQAELVAASRATDEVVDLDEVQRDLAAYRALDSERAGLSRVEAHLGTLARHVAALTRAVIRARADLAAEEAKGQARTIIASGAVDAYTAVAQALGFAATDGASPDDVVDRATGLGRENTRLQQMLKASNEDSAQQRALVQALGRIRADSSCLTCGGTGNGPDGATCSCVGWAPKVDDVEVQNAVAREIAHALGDEVPPTQRLAVTLALGLQLVQVHTLRERWAAMQGRESSTAQGPSLTECLVAAGADTPGAWGVSVAWPVHGNGEDEIEEPVGGVATHPADCQTCSEGSDPCATHAQDWRYWQGRCLDAENGHKNALEELSAIGALLGWASGKAQERPKAHTRVERLLAQVIDERNGLAAKLADLLAQVESDDLIATLPAAVIGQALRVGEDAFSLLEHVAEDEPVLDAQIGRIHQLALDAPRMARAVIATRAQLAEVKQALARAQGTVEHLRDREAAFLAALTAAGYAPADGGQYRADCASAVARMAEDLAALKRAQGAPSTMLSNPDVQVWWEPERNVR